MNMGSLIAMAAVACIEGIKVLALLAFVVGLLVAFL